jgi:predicted SnoaL-like aldol condensation-catalyzing enzyme
MSIAEIDWRVAFVNDWRAAWDDKDTEKILSFYQDGFAMNSPIVCECLGINKVPCIGKMELEKFCNFVFKNFPKYVIRIVGTSLKGETITLHYHDCFARLVAETMQFSHDRKIMNSVVFY